MRCVGMGGVLLMSHGVAFSYSVWEVWGGGGRLGVTECNLKLLHIGYLFYFCVVYIVLFDFALVFCFY